MFSSSLIIPVAFSLVEKENVFARVELKSFLTLISILPFRVVI